MQDQEIQPEPLVNFGWIGESWRLFSANVGTWVIFAVVLTFGPSILSFVGQALITLIRATQMAQTMGHPLGTPASPPPPMQPEIILITGILSILELLLTCFLYSGGFLMAVKQVRGELITTSDIFGGLPYLGKFIGFTLIVSAIVSVIAALPALAIVQSMVAKGDMHPTANLIGAMVAGGFLIFLLCAVIYALFLPSYPMLINGEDVTTMISVSFQTMKYDLGRAVGLVLLLGLINAATILTCGLGTFVTIPMTFLVCALVYRDMVGMPISVNNPDGQSHSGGTGVWPPKPSIGTYYGQPQYPMEPEPPQNPPQMPGNSRE